MPITITRRSILYLTTLLLLASFQSVIEAQPGNPSQPPVFNPGQLPVKMLIASEPLRLQLSGPFDLAYYAAAPQTISIHVVSLPGNPSPLDTTLEIDDSQGNQIVFNDDFSADSRDAGADNVSLPAAGTYAIHLSTFDLLEGGGVEVRLTTSAQPIGNNPGSGNILDVAGKLDGSGPATFNFDGTVGQVVTVLVAAVNPPSPDLDLSLILYGPDGAQVASDDDTGGTNGLGERDPALMHFILPQTGTYRLEVSSWFDTPGDITVKVVPG